MRTYLRMGDDTLNDAKAFGSKAAAIEKFRETAAELAKFEQRITASLHVARNFSEIHEYPDCTLSLSSRGAVVQHRT